MHPFNSEIFSRIAFIFIVFVILSGGFVSDLLSCQMREFLTNSLYFRHIVAILLIFVFIMLEGGWDTDLFQESNTNWSCGNVKTTILFAVLIYMLFLISSKSQLIPNLIFYGLIFLLYCINTQRNYDLKNQKISTETNTKILNGEYIMFGVAVCVLIYGFVDYAIYQNKEHKSDFSWKTFILGTAKCKKLEK